MKLISRMVSPLGPALWLSTDLSHASRPGRVTLVTIRMLLVLFTSLALFLSLAMVTSSRAPAQENPHEFQSPGQTIANYLGYKVRLELRIELAGQALERCGQCDDRQRLQADYDRLLQEERDVRAGEGFVFQQLHLPYKDIRELSAALFLGLKPNYDKMPSDVANARFRMVRAIVNYCYATSETPAEEAACRKAYQLNNVNEIITSAPKRCLDGVQNETGVKLHIFPAPDAPHSVQAAHDSAWLQYEACLKGNDLYQVMREGTNKICQVADIGPALEPDQFKCACVGRTPPAALHCQTPPPTPRAEVIESLMPQDPVRKLAHAGSYGPKLLGVQIGMPLSVAEAIVRKHMPVGDEYAIGLVKAPKTSTYGYQDLRGLEYITQGLQGHLFVSADQQEFFAVFDAPPNLPGRVVVATRGVWLTGVQEQAEAAEMRAEKGEPYSFLGTVLVWGGPSRSPPCINQDAGFNPDIWVKQGVALPDWLREERGLVRLIGLPLLASQTTSLSACDPVFTRRTGGDPSRPGRPVSVVEKLYDLSLLDWFRDQRQAK